MNDTNTPLQKLRDNSSRSPSNEFMKAAAICSRRFSTQRALPPSTRWDIFSLENPRVDTVHVYLLTKKICKNSFGFWFYGVLRAQKSHRRQKSVFSDHRSVDSNPRPLPCTSKDDSDPYLSFEKKIVQKFPAVLILRSFWLLRAQ